MLLLLPSLLLSRSLCCSVAEHTSLCMFAVHSQRDKNIAANQAMLAQLGLLEDATALRTSQQKTHQQKPKVKKATLLRCRAASPACPAEAGEAGRAGGCGAGSARRRRRPSSRRSASRPASHASSAR